MKKNDVALLLDKYGDDGLEEYGSIKEPEFCSSKYNPFVYLAKLEVSRRGHGARCGAKINRLDVGDFAGRDWDYIGYGFIVSIPLKIMQDKRRKYYARKEANRLGMVTRRYEAGDEKVCFNKNDLYRKDLQKEGLQVTSVCRHCGLLMTADLKDYDLDWTRRAEFCSSCKSRELDYFINYGDVIAMMKRKGLLARNRTEVNSKKK